jgi:alpha/beta superfamily hydrolase
MKNITKAIYFNHGSESTPWGEKIQRLSEVGKEKGFAIESINYMGVENPEKRVSMLLNSLNNKFEQLVLVGSSMGGYVATVASKVLQPQGLFLLAPAFYIEDYQIQEPYPYAKFTTIVHGWQDEEIPVESSIKFAKKYNAQLHILQDSHRLLQQIGIITSLFSIFLDQIQTP